jgi:ADP-ribose diphosphatase
MMPETLLTASKFRVERRSFNREGAASVDREVVVHPGAVVILPLLDDGRMVMIRNQRDIVEEELLELPAGTLEVGESPIDAASRELEEETGFLAGVMKPFVEFYSTPGFCTELIRSYEAHDLTETQQNLDAGEVIRVEVCEVDRLKRAMYDGTIRDAKTLAVLGAYFMKDRS